MPNNITPNHPSFTVTTKATRKLQYTVKVERFAGLNIRGFNAIMFFTEIISRKFHSALTTSVYCLPIAKNSWENFCGTLKNHKNYESLAQQIFPRLWYITCCRQGAVRKLSFKMNKHHCSINELPHVLYTNLIL